MSNGGKRVWGWANSSEAEDYTGEHATREEAIAEAVADSEEDQEIWVIEGCYPLPSSLIRDDVVERMLEVAEENAEVGWYDGEIFSVSQEATDALMATIRAWADEHVKVHAWGGMGTPEVVRYADGRFADGGGKK